MPRSVVAGAVLVLALVALAAVGPLAASDPVAADIDHGLADDGSPLPPSSHPLLGTDPLGRDVWARVTAGARTSLVVTGLATALAVAIGLAVGLAAGYAGGRTDALLMRLVDLVLAFPFVLLAILLAALVRTTSLAGSSAPVVIALGASGWTSLARVVRDRARVVANGDMVTAARALGASPWRIVTRHVLPNVGGIAAAMTALAFAQNLLGEAMLSYAGLGPPPPAATWGRMLYDGRLYYRTAPWLVAAPGIAIVVAVLAFYLIGTGLQERDA